MYLNVAERCLERDDFDLCQDCFAQGNLRHLAFMSIDSEGALPVYVRPIAPAVASPPAPQSAVASPPAPQPVVDERIQNLAPPDDQNLVELKKWFKENKFSEDVLRRLMIHPGVQDVMDLACLNDEELQQAGLTPIQLKRFALLQHKMNDPNERPTINQLSQMLEDVRKQLRSGVISREAADYITKGISSELARETRTDASGLIEIFLANLDPSPPVPVPPPVPPPVPLVPDVPQFVSFTPEGSFKIKISRPGEKDQIVETDSTGRLDLKGLPLSSAFTLQPMTNTEPPLLLGATVQMQLPLTAAKTVDLPASTVRPIFQDQDIPMACCQGQGEFVEPSGSTAKFSATTDKDGSFNLVLPAGTISRMHVRSDDGKVTVAASSMSVESRVPGTSPVTLRTIWSQKGSKIPFLKHCRGNHVAFLGDTSGSMDGEGIELLKRSLHAAVEDVLVPLSTKTVAFCAWNSSTEWFQNKRWLTAADNDAIKRWIGQLKADGGTTMRPALEEAILLRDVSDIVVLCDGKCENFDFDAIRKRCPKIDFSFIALGASADWQKMQKMAHAAGSQGFFYHEK